MAGRDHVIPDTKGSGSPISCGLKMLRSYRFFGPRQRSMYLCDGFVARVSNLDGEVPDVTSN